MLLVPHGIGNIKMAGNLVVISGSEICFSDYIRKPNELLTRLDLLNFIDIHRKRFIIPLKHEALISMVSGKPDPLFNEEPIPNGPLSVVIHNGSCVSETSSLDGKLKSSPVFYSGMNWYVRSDLHSLESAATAAQTIYGDPLKIAAEAFKACGINRPPLLIGEIANFEKALDQFLELEIILSSSNPKSKKYKQAYDIFLKLRYSLESFFKLKKVI